MFVPMLLNLLFLVVHLLVVLISSTTMKQQLLILHHWALELMILYILIQMKMVAAILLNKPLP